MSITICYPYLLNPTGGSFVSTKLLIENLGIDFECHLVFGQDGSAARDAKKNDLQTTVLPLGDSILKRIEGTTGVFDEVAIGFRLLPYMWKIRQFLKTEAVDLVHINDGLTAMVWGSAAKTAGVPVIWHVRSERANEWDKIRLKLCSYLILVAESNKQRFSQNDLNKISSSVVYNGVDLSSFSPQDSNYLHDELDIEPDIPIVGFVGNLVSRKRPMLFVESAIEVLERKDDVHFVLVGKDQRDFADKITCTAQKAGCEDNIHLLGYRSDVHKIMPSLTLLALTSTERGEAFPRVPVEAMACGTPVVTTDTAGVSEAVIDGETGFVLGVDPSPKELAAKITGLLEDQDTLEQFSAKSPTRVKKKFTARQTASKISGIYEQL